ncbi:tetratricopeptide repeat protein [Chitinophaga horti]|uniref:Tetratricopeptide repeat protein n=1 Tax=Chitinophaga horti TaxID=2920382 RepID=A0ABY6J8C3_9BACT|nr:tetratricopeptide repeat protein [Chitinophaga horti]UYQ94822.1 tetratricopeptide repeat protein [Chitinophaga horti]
MMMASLRYILFATILLTGFTAHAQLFKKGSGDADALYEQAVQATKQKQYAKAIALSKQALAKQPDFVDQQLLLGRLYMLTGDNKNARVQVNAVIAKAPRYRDAYFYAINIEMTEKKYEEAGCFVDEALYEFPNDKELMLKKLSIMDASGKFYRGDSYAPQLLDRFPEDTTVRNAYIGHYLMAADVYKRAGNSVMAKTNYEKVLAIQPANEEAKAAITTMYVQNRNYTSALEQVNAELATNPKSYELLMKKLGLQEQMHAYPDALATLKEVLKYYPNDSKARQMETQLRMDAAGYYTDTDPYMLYQSVLEKSPGNRAALDKVIGLSMSRGAYREALAWINRGLKSNPNDQRLLGLKADVLEADRKFTEAATITGRLRQLNPGSTDLRNRYTYLKVQSGRDYLAQQQYDLAIAELENARQVSPSDTTVLDMLANTYIGRRDYNRALTALDNALSYYPNNPRFLTKKSSVLAEMGRYDEAAEIVETLLNNHPNDERYASTFVDLRLTAGRILMQSEEYDMARQQFALVLAQAPDNLDALNYMINLQSATKQADSALAYADQGLSYYPDNKDLLLKKSAALTELKRYAEANDINAQLLQRYPFTLRYKTAYTDGLLQQGQEYQRNNQPDSALQAFRKVLSMNRRDSLALLYSINIYSSRGQNDSALALAQEGLRYYPSQETFLQKRVVSLENQQRYAEAALAADSLVKLNGSAANTDYADFLRSKTLKNQFGLYYLNTQYDYSDNRYQVATLEYRRFIKRGSIAGRISYAGRAQGTGIQGELEAFINHSKSLYSYGIATYSNEVAFPQLRLGYSIFKTFKHDIEAELGARYLKADSVESIAGVVSLAKTFNDFWVNGRAYFISDSSDFYTSFNLTTRYYMNRGQDFLSVFAGLGTSPDDRSRLIAFPQLSGLLTRSVGAGYQKTIKYRNTLSINGTWINQKIGDSQFQNQYDIYLMFLRKF